MRATRIAIASVLGVLSAGVSPVAHATGYLGYDKQIPSVGGGANNAQNIDITENLGEKVPRDLSFVDGHGRTVTIGSLLDRGKPVLLTLGYFSCPMLCNLVHEGLAKAIKQSNLKLGEDFVALSVSVDPKEDRKSANTLQGRLLRNLGHGEATDWPFVFDTRVGDKPGLATTAKALSDSVGFRYFYDAESKQFAHAAVAFVLTPDGKISHYLYGVDFPARDLKFALVEAGGGRVGTTLDRVLLACFKYDPMSRKYTPFVAGFVRIGAFVCFLALAALLSVLWWKELQMRKQGRPV